MQSDSPVDFGSQRPAFLNFFVSSLYLLYLLTAPNTSYLSAMKRKLLKLLLIIAPVMVLELIFSLFIYQQSLNLFPNEEVETNPYADNENKGKSFVNSFEVKDKEINYAFTLKQGFPYPYAGISFVPKGGFFKHMTRYDYVDFEITSKKEKELYIYLLAYEPTVYKEGDDVYLRHLKKVIPTQNRHEKVRVYLDEFKTAEWWYIQVDRFVHDMGAPDFNNIRKLNISSVGTAPLDVMEEIQVKSIRFGTSYTPFFLWSAGFTSLYYLLIFLVPLLLKRDPKAVTIVIPHRASEIQDKTESELDTCTKWFFEHYTDPDISLDKMALELGISSRKISDIINSNFKMSFKQYLNTMRLNEAKALLSQTDWPIKEIAMKVGFSNTSHFNRTFKQYQNMKPLEFRKDYSPVKHQEGKE